MRQLGGKTPDLVLVFATTCYDQEGLLAAVSAGTRGAPLSGCSGEGVITQAGGEEVTHAVSVTAIAHPGLHFRTFAVEEAAKDPVAAARTLAAMVEEGRPVDPRVMFLFPDGITIDCGKFLGELERRLTISVQLGGGNAGTQMGPADTWKTYQYHGTRAFRGGVSAVLVSGDFQVEMAVNHGCESLGIDHTITRSDGALVAEIDHRPAFDVLKDYLEGDPQDLNDNLDSHVLLGVPLPAEQQKGYGTVVIRAPIQLDKPTGALFFTGGGLPTGCRVEMVRRDIEHMQKGALQCAQTIAGKHPGEKPFLVFQFDCSARGRIICGDRATEITVRPLQRVLGTDVPWSGFYTFGEIAPLQGKAYYHACTIGLWAFYALRGRGGNAGAED